MSVKDKPLKKCHSDARITIDVVHKDIVDEFTKQKLSIEKSVEKSNEIEDDINDYYLDITLYTRSPGLAILYFSLASFSIYIKSFSNRFFSEIKTSRSFLSSLMCACIELFSFFNLYN